MATVFSLIGLLILVVSFTLILAFVTHWILSTNFPNMPKSKMNTISVGIPVGLFIVSALAMFFYLSLWIILFNLVVNFLSAGAVFFYLRKKDESDEEINSI